MDGFETNEGVILIAATNRPDVLDPALLRPGRFDRRVVVDRPDINGRLGILQVHTKNIPLAEDVSLDKLARGTPGFAGADLANLVNEAALVAARLNKKKVEMADFEFAKDKVLMGAERKSMILTEEEKAVTAYHEAGHAVVAAFLPGHDPLHKVTIIPRGRALGVTMQLPMEDKHNYTRNYIASEIAILMGGRIAEEMTQRDITTGASNDIERATAMARRMVCEWGMSELGPLAFGQGDEPVFLGRDFQQRAAYSEETAQRIDTEVQRIVREAYERARGILASQRAVLVRIARELLEHESLEGSEIYRLIEELTGQKLEPAPQPPKPTRTPPGGPSAPAVAGTPGSAAPAGGPTIAPEPSPA
jgi:cell division protease FtsH